MYRGRFADYGLLHEIIVSIAPVALGDGAPLLPRELELRVTEVAANGEFACLRYEVVRETSGRAVGIQAGGAARYIRRFSTSTGRRVESDLHFAAGAGPPCYPEETEAAQEAKARGLRVCSSTRPGPVKSKTSPSPDFSDWSERPETARRMVNCIARS